MKRLVECVPNFSEGRKPEVVEQIARAIESVRSAVVLDTHIDPDHNRSVITFVAAPEFATEAAVKAVEVAAQLIDLREHGGEHPRLGATDVLPFVPVAGVTMDECVELANATGERIARDLSIPVYLYEKAAKTPDRVNLEDVRRGGFELLRDEIGTARHRKPDFGALKIHESAGATIVGARPILIAFNVNLNTNDVSVARRIAKAVRGRDGGLKYLKALGFELRSRGIVQVSMNLVDFEKTQLHQAFEAVRRGAEHEGVMIAGSEIVGLVPRSAIERAAEYFMRLENFSPGIVLEERISMAYRAKGERDSTADFVEQLSSDKATPGGGAASAYAATLGASLGEMMARLTVGRKKYADFEGEILEALGELRPLREKLQRAVEDDAVSFSRVLEARRLSNTTDVARSHRENKIEEALKNATIVPLEVAGTALQVLGILETLAEIGNPNALSDAATGAQLVQAAVASARYNVLVNTVEIMDDEFRIEHCARMDDLVERAGEIMARIESLFLEAVKSQR